MSNAALQLTSSYLTPHQACAFSLTSLKRSAVQMKSFPPLKVPRPPKFSPQDEAADLSQQYNQDPTEDRQKDSVCMSVYNGSWSEFSLNTVYLEVDERSELKK